MLSRLRNRQRGFTLIELLIVVAIIGIIAALLIPNFLDALQKAKQKRTVADARNVGTAMMSWLTDQEAAAAAGQANNTVTVASYGTKLTIGTVEDILEPQYMQEVPQYDGWKKEYDYRMNSDFSVRSIILIGSTGQRGNGSLQATYVPGAFDPTDYQQDIVWADGFFVRWPAKVTN
jgi:type II secretion system protein G